MNCPHCGHESFSLSSSEVHFSAATSYTASFVCGGCRWQSPAGIATTHREASKIAETRLNQYRKIWSK